ncbi:MAG: DUF1638 domain-containing protein [Hyphomicrobiaceae bacterium]|nr:DUF1638 domain-containing protein [Hyphomicrobiaceae bacterium]
MSEIPKTLVIACGALARELVAVVDMNRFEHLAVTALPAILHNRPEKIPGEVRRKIRANKAKYARIVVLYGDCGTGGLLDAMLAEEGVERIDGEHCYAFYAGLDTFAAMHEAEIGTFYLTDYMVRHFDRLIWKGLGLDRYPQLFATYFGHYTRIMYLAQLPDAALEAKARAIAERMKLRFEMRATGLGGIGGFLEPINAG